MVYDRASPAVVLIRTTPGTVAIRRLLPPYHPEIEKTISTGWDPVRCQRRRVRSQQSPCGHGADSISVVLSDRRAFRPPWSDPIP